MYKILTLNAISDKGLVKLPAQDFEIASEMADPQGIIVRSADMLTYEMPQELLGIARAGAGTNNIPADICTEKGIVVFNTPGANANAVKELVITALLLSSRKVVEGIEWGKSLKGQENVGKLVEAGKKQFVGPEIKGKKLGVIGLGAIGVLVANTAIHLGMDVLGYDPFLSVQSAWNINSDVELKGNIEDLVAQCDYITIHVPLVPNTKNMYNETLFAATKPGCKLLNFSRGGLVDNAALKVALENGTIERYVTDFPDEEIFSLEHVLAIPHLGASTPESEENCAEMAAMEMKAFLKYGVIKNSINFPNCEATYTGKTRITIAHKNVPDMVGAIAAAFSKAELNIDNMVNKSKGEVAYTIIDIDSLNGKGDALMADLSAIPEVMRARLVREA